MNCRRAVSNFEVAPNSVRMQHQEGAVKYDPFVFSRSIFTRLLKTLVLTLMEMGNWRITTDQVVNRTGTYMSMCRIRSQKYHTHESSSSPPKLRRILVWCLAYNVPDTNDDSATRNEIVSPFLHLLILDKPSDKEI